MASPFAPDFVDRVRSAVDIVSLISETSPLKKAGRKFRGLCPFHPEKTPSFYVDEAKGLFYCFGCQAGGDPFKFVMQRDGVDFPEAVRVLARRAGIPTPEVSPARRSEREQIVAAHRAAADCYHELLVRKPEGKPGRDYLTARGITPETIARLKLGFAPDRWDTLKGYLATKGFNPEHLLTGGLLARSETRGTTYDRFRNRVIFPIRSLTGEVVGFGGRLIGPGDAKYLNSAETPIYNKREHLFGLDQARQAIRDAGEAIVVEGYLDAVSLWQAGIPNVVATLGTAFAEEQAGLLRRFADRIVVNYDPDDAGVAATRRSLELLLPRGFRVRVLALDKGEDPDAFVRRHGAEAYRERLQSAPRFLEWLLDRICAGRDLDDPGEKSAALAELLPVLSSLPDRIERAGCLGTLSERLQIQDELVLSEVRDALIKGGRTRVTVPRPRPEAPMLVAEERLVRALLQESDLRVELLDRLTREDLAGSAAERLVRAVEGMASRGEEVSWARLNEILDEPTRSQLARLAMRPEPHVSREEALLSLDSIRLRRLRLERDRLQKQMEKEANSAQLDTLLRRKIDLSRQIDALS